VHPAQLRAKTLEKIMATQHNVTRISLVKLVDRLGHLSAEAADLKNEIDDAKQTLRDSGLPVVEGLLFRATVGKESQSANTDWEAIAKEFIPAPFLAALVEKHTTRSSRAGSVRVVARIGGK
jgi:uncharacterized protein (UPF0335 family)